MMDRISDEERESLLQEYLDGQIDLDDSEKQQLCSDIDLYRALIGK